MITLPQTISKILLLINSTISEQLGQGKRRDSNICKSQILRRYLKFGLETKCSHIRFWYEVLSLNLTPR